MVPNKTKVRELNLLTALMMLLALTGWAMADVTGTVYNDLNRNGQMDAGEPGIADVCVSNSKEVVKTDANGQYSLPEYDDMVVFVVKPTGYMTAVDPNNTPKFYYVHKPAGSPADIQHFRGLEPTGPLPAAIDFPLYEIDEPMNFKAVITGDTQSYTPEEIDYVRDSFISDVVANHSDARLMISMGDNLGDDLALFGRYLSVMGSAGMPVYLVPGNHDNDFDAPTDQHSCDTYKSYVGPSYCSFNYGKVHFIVLDSVLMPGHTNFYDGGIDPVQMEWLANDLANTPMDYLIVLNMHIPLVNDVDRPTERHQVPEAGQIYQLLEGRKAVSLGGHTHTLSNFLPGEELEGWGEPTQIDQIIVGAACGSWWTGDVDAAGVPVAYMRDGVPRNYLVFEFRGNEYTTNFKATGQGAEKQMHMSFMTQKVGDWVAANTSGDPTLYVSRNELIDRNVLKVSDLTDPQAHLVVNFYNGSRSALVLCQFDERPAVDAFYDLNAQDPFALMNELYILRTVPGYKLWDDEGTGPQYGPGDPQPLDEWLWTTAGRSTHLWTCDIPDDLEPGVHKVTVGAQDRFGHYFEDVLMFEVVAD